MPNWLTRSLISPMVLLPRRTAVPLSTTGTLFMEISLMSSEKLPSSTCTSAEYARALKNGELATLPMIRPKISTRMSTMIQKMNPCCFFSPLARLRWRRLPEDSSPMSPAPSAELDAELPRRRNSPVSAPRKPSRRSVSPKSVTNSEPASCRRGSPKHTPMTTRHQMTNHQKSTLLMLMGGIVM